jgi:beta-1,4-N-acetylglucosaminyltransferase
VFRKNEILCVVCSAGGHLTEALLSVAGVEYPRYFITYKLPHLDKSLRGEEYYYITNPHKYPWRYPWNFLQSLWYFLRKKPKFILSTGSGMAIATCIIGKILGSKIIFVESGARVSAPSLTGLLLYHFSDLFIVQWPGLLKQFPRAVFGGLLF